MFHYPVGQVFHYPSGQWDHDKSFHLCENCLCKLTDKEYEKLLVENPKPVVQKPNWWSRLNLFGRVKNWF